MNKKQPLGLKNKGKSFEGMKTIDFILPERKPKLAIKVWIENIFYPFSFNFEFS
jgi:hypothetical protein